MHTVICATPADGRYYGENPLDNARHIGSAQWPRKRYKTVEHNLIEKKGLGVPQGLLSLELPMYLVRYFMRRISPIHMYLQLARKNTGIPFSV